MKFQEVNIATARIEGLTTSPYDYDRNCNWEWHIFFSDASTRFKNLVFIHVGYTEEEAVDFCNQLKENFNQANIYDGDKVAILFETNGRVRAIGSLGQDSWIDVEDKFVKKTFKELNIVITSLKVH